MPGIVFFLRFRYWIIKEKPAFSGNEICHADSQSPPAFLGKKPEILEISFREMTISQSSASYPSTFRSFRKPIFFPDFLLENSDFFIGEFQDFFGVSAPGNRETSITGQKILRDLGGAAPRAREGAPPQYKYRISKGRLGGPPLGGWGSKFYFSKKMSEPNFLDGDF